ncbi:zinc transporter ZIP2 [Carettochelys insculpta]|uniref:zinc transporter ZIP2 n=1 Tax=Carettochelys insculpta TaxID=44489 RepID=UPI003EBD789B
MEPLLAVKVGCLLALLLLTLLCGLLPVQLRWFHRAAATGWHRRLLSFIGCMAGGIFLGACLMHTVANALTDLQEQVAQWLQPAGLGQNLTGSQNNSSRAGACVAELAYPLPELVIALGFFLVFLTESLVLQCRPAGSPGKEPDPDLHSHGAPAPGDPSAGSFRALALFATLALHAVFEGLAVGVQPAEEGALQLCLAVLAHKAVIAFGLGLRLAQGGVGPRWRLLYLAVFALMSPAGLAVGIGLSLSGSTTGGGGLAVALLEGLAAGTFLYITFLEILPHELSAPEPPLAKFSCVALGFAVMAVIAVWA